MSEEVVNRFLRRDLFGRDHSGLQVKGRTETVATCMDTTRTLDKSIVVQLTEDRGNFFQFSRRRRLLLYHQKFSLCLNDGPGR